MDNFFSTIMAVNNKTNTIFLSNFNFFSVMKPLWIESLDTWEPHINENGVIVIINESHTLWNSGFRLVALAVGVLIQYICPVSKKYAVKSSLWISIIFILSYATFMGTFHLISWFPFSFTDILKVSKMATKQKAFVTIVLNKINI